MPATQQSPDPKAKAKRQKPARAGRSTGRNRHLEAQLELLEGCQTLTSRAREVKTEIEGMKIGRERREKSSENDRATRTLVALRYKRPAEQIS